VQASTKNGGGKAGDARGENRGEQSQSGAGRQKAAAPAGGEPKTFAADSPSPTHAGLCVRAADTGRVLMLCRADAPGDPAAGTWESIEPPEPGSITNDIEGQIGDARPHHEQMQKWAAARPESLATKSAVARAAARLERLNPTDLAKG